MQILHVDLLAACFRGLRRVQWQRILFFLASHFQQFFKIPWKNFLVFINQSHKFSKKIFQSFATSVKDTHKQRYNHDGFKNVKKTDSLLKSKPLFFYTKCPY